MTTTTLFWTDTNTAAWFEPGAKAWRNTRKTLGILVVQNHLVLRKHVDCAHALELVHLQLFHRRHHRLVLVRRRVVDLSSSRQCARAHPAQPDPTFFTLRRGVPLPPMRTFAPAAALMREAISVGAMLQLNPRPSRQPKSRREMQTQCV